MRTPFAEKKDSTRGSNESRSPVTTCGKKEPKGCKKDGEELDLQKAGSSVEVVCDEDGTIVEVVEE